MTHNECPSIPSQFSILGTIGSSSGWIHNFRTNKTLLLPWGVTVSPTNNQKKKLFEFIGTERALFVNAIGYSIDGGKKTGADRGPPYLAITGKNMHLFATTKVVSIFIGLDCYVLNRNYKLPDGKEVSGQWAIQAQWLINKLALERVFWFVALVCVFTCLLMWYSTNMASAVGVAAITSLSFLTKSFFPRTPSFVIDCGGKSMTVYSASLPYWRIGRIFGFVPSNVRYIKNQILTACLQKSDVNPNKLYAADPTGQSFAYEANQAIDSLNLDPDEVIVFQTGKMRQDGVKTSLSSGYQLRLLSQEDEIRLELLDLVQNVFGRPITSFTIDVDGDVVTATGI